MVDVQFQSQCFEHIGAAAMAGNRPLAMLGHLNAASSHNEGGSSGYIKGIGPISACATGIQDGFVFNVYFIPINVYPVKWSRN
jgi:hypothetical protein